MLSKILENIKATNLIDGEVIGMTANQLDEFARNIPEKITSCNVFGIDGYGKDDSGRLSKTFRIVLMRSMPYHFNLEIADKNEMEMSVLMFKIFDKLDSEMILINSPRLTPQLLSYDKTTLIVFADFTFLSEVAICGMD